MRDVLRVLRRRSRGGRGRIIGAFTHSIDVGVNDERFPSKRRDVFRNEAQCEIEKRRYSVIDVEHRGGLREDRRSCGVIRPDLLEA